MTGETDALRETWDDVSGAWDRFEPELAAFTAPIRDALLDGLELRPEDRVLRAGGRIGAATWGPPQANPWIVMIGAALLQHGHTVAGDPLGPGGIFSLSTADVLEAAFRGAGFRDRASYTFHGRGLVALGRV